LLGGSGLSWHGSMVHARPLKSRMLGRLIARSFRSVLTGACAESAVLGMTLIRSTKIPRIGVHMQRIEVHPMGRHFEPEQVLLRTVMLVGRGSVHPPDTRGFPFRLSAYEGLFQASNGK
jgi:hypothetical protein